MNKQEDVVVSNVSATGRQQNDPEAESRLEQIFDILLSDEVANSKVQVEQK